MATITSLIDPLFEGVARESGLPVEDISTRFGGELLGAATEAVVDMGAKGWFAKAIQVVAGLISNGYAIYGKGVDPRVRRELLTFGNHEFLRIVDPTPDRIREIRESVEGTIDGIKTRDTNKVLASMFRSKSEILGMGGKITKRTENPAGGKTGKMGVEIETPGKVTLRGGAEGSKPSDKISTKTKGAKGSAF